MGSFAFTDVTAYLAGYDITTDVNELALSVSCAELESTTLGIGGSKAFVGGLKESEGTLTGLWQSAASAAVDPEAITNFAVADQVLTVSQDDLETATAYLLQVGKFGYQIFGKDGELAPFRLRMRGTNGVGVVRGQLAKLKGNVSGTGVLGSVVNLGAPTSAQFVYSTVHIFSAGTTITLQLQSDDAAGFASPTTRATIGPLTTTGGTWMTRLAGPFVGETHWRLNISAITGTFSIAAGIAVQ